jgi:hypothetical protein
MAAEREAGTPGVAGPIRPHSLRRAFCPLCGDERTDIYLSDVRNAEDALCPEHCADAWETLAALRAREAADPALSARRQLEYEAGEAHAPKLSELLLDRWRAHDWSVMPGDLLARIDHPAPDDS